MHESLGKLLGRPAVLVGVFLGAVVAANLAVAHWGQAALVMTAWVLIPFDLVTRDVLHERWTGKALWPRMAALIAGGAVLTAVLNADASRVAFASCCAFAAAGTANAAVYHLLRARPRLVRMNASNAVAAVTDSVVFPLLAFNEVSALLCGSQAAAKFAGGLMWSWLFVRLIWRRK